jgi:hypothetical protein
MISALGSTYTTKTDGQATGGAYSPVEEELWGDPTPLHVHSREKEAFYVLFGRLDVWVDGTETVAAPGMFLVIPRGAPHAARRIGDEPPQVAPQHLANEDVLLSALTVTNGSSWRACYASCSWASNKSS